MKIKINFFEGYAGGIKAEAEVNGERCILNFENLEAFLAKAIQKKGYTVEKTKQQKIPRLLLNI